MKIEILGPGCPRCKQLFQNVEKAVKDLHLSASIEKIEDINKIMSYGVMITPALAIDGEIKSAGKVLTVEEIKELLK